MGKTLACLPVTITRKSEIFSYEWTLNNDGLPVKCVRSSSWKKAEKWSPLTGGKSLFQHLNGDGAEPNLVQPRRHLLNQILIFIIHPNAFAPHPKYCILLHLLTCIVSSVSQFYHLFLLLVKHLLIYYFYRTYYVIIFQIYLPHKKRKIFQSSVSLVACRRLTMSVQTNCDLVRYSQLLAAMFAARCQYSTTISGLHFSHEIRVCSFSS